MSAAPVYSPIIRRVRDSSITFDGIDYPHEELGRHDGSDVFCDMEIDVNIEKRCFRIYDAWENEICMVELKEVASVEEAIGFKCI